MVNMDDTTGRTDDNISRVVELFMTARHLNRALVAKGTGIGESTFERRVTRARKGGRWTALELAMLSAYFEVPAQVFLDGPSALLTGPRDRNG